MTTNIYSMRWSAGYGWQAVHERSAMLTELPQWLTIFQTAEPDVLFITQSARPTAKQIRAMGLVAPRVALLS